MYKVTIYEGSTLSPHRVEMEIERYVDILDLMSIVTKSGNAISIENEINNVD